MNPTTSGSTTSPPSSPASVGAFASSEPNPNPGAAPPAAAKDFAGGDVDGLSGGEAKAWGRLRDYEAEEAQTINDRLLARRQQQQQQTPMVGSGDTFMPDGDLLFTDRYIQRFLEEEERAKRESADWTRNLDSSTARFRADGKERDPITMPSTSSSHYDHYTENGEAEGYADVEYGDSGASHHHVGVRSSLSSVSRALGRKVKFSSSKITASLGSRRIHRKDKGKEAATGSRHRGFHYEDASDYYSTTTAQQQQQHPLYDVADAGLLPAYVVPSGTTLPEAEPLFPLFNAGLAPAAARSSATSTGDFEKTWGRDYSPFSTYAFDQRPAAAQQPPQQEPVNVFDSDDEGAGSDLPPLEHLHP